MKEDSPLCIPGISSIIYARKELLDIERSYVRISSTFGSRKQVTG